MCLSSISVSCSANSCDTSFLTLYSSSISFTCSSLTLAMASSLHWARRSFRTWKAKENNKINEKMSSREGDVLIVLKIEQNDIESRLDQTLWCNEPMAIYKDTCISTLQLTQSAVFAPIGGRFSSMWLSQLRLAASVPSLSMFCTCLASVFPCTAADAVRVGSWLGVGGGHIEVDTRCIPCVCVCRTFVVGIIWKKKSMLH